MFQHQNYHVNGGEMNIEYQKCSVSHGFRNSIVWNLNGYAIRTQARAHAHERTLAPLKIILNWTNEHVQIFHKLLSIQIEYLFWISPT